MDCELIAKEDLATGIVALGGSCALLLWDLERAATYEEVDHHKSGPAPPKNGATMGIFKDPQGCPQIKDSSHSLKKGLSDCEFSCLLSSRSLVQIQQGASSKTNTPTPLVL